MFANSSPEMKALLKEIGPEFRPPEYRYRMNSIDSCSSEDEAEPAAQQEKQLPPVGDAPSALPADGGKQQQLREPTTAAVGAGAAAVGPSARVDPPLPEQTLLHEMVAIDRIDKVAKQLKKGTSVNAEDCMGETPLFWAESVEAVDYLVKEGADLHHRNNVCDCSAFYKLACQGKHRPLKALAHHLRKAGRLDEYVNEPSSHTRRTPLHAAACNGFTETVRELLAMGADKHLQDYLGKTAVDLAKRRELLEVLQLLA